MTQLASTEAGSVAARAGQSTRSHVASDPTSLWTKGVMPGLENRLEREDDAPNQQAIADRNHQRPTGESGSPSCHAAPNAEREHTGQDDHLDNPCVRDTRDGQYHQDHQWRDRDQQESALFNKDAPAFAPA